MTGSDDQVHFEVPVGRLGGGRGPSRRAGTLAAAAIVVVLGGAIALAHVPDTSVRTAEASATVPTSVAPTAPPSFRPQTPRRTEQLFDAGNLALAGAPDVTLVERAGYGLHDAQIVVWTPADGRTATVATIAGAFPETPGQVVLPVVAPDRRHLLVLTPDSAGGQSGDAGRLIDERGTVMWTGTGITAPSGGLWSADSSLVVVPGQPRRWHLVRVDRPGHATDRTIPLPGSIYVPRSAAGGSTTVPAVESRTVPVGFSSDGSWIYGAVFSPQLGTLTGIFRVSVRAGKVERLTDFRVGRRDGLVPRAGTGGTRIVDPSTGRTASFRINPDTTGGAETVDVRAPDSHYLFSVEAPATFGTDWAGDSGLVALTADSLLFPESVQLRRIGPDGRSGAPLLATGPVTGAALVGSRDGFAVVAILVTRPHSAAELVAVDLAQPNRVTSTLLPSDPSISVVAATVDR